MTISIIANFYKSGKFIPRLLKSVFAQTYTDWHLICVVDASPGNDVSVIRRLVNRYGMHEKVTVIVNRENLGLSRSKKVGIDAAKGDYLTFIDGDDYLHPRALEHLAAPAIKYGVDMVSMDHYRHYPVFNRNNIIKIDTPDFPYERVLRRDEFIDRCFMIFYKGSYISYTYWGKLYKVSLFERLNFDYPDRQNVFAEDKWFSFEMFQIIDSAYFVDFAGYYWRWGGVSNNRRTAEWTMRRLVDDFITHDATLKQAADKLNYAKGIPELMKWKYRVLTDYIVSIATASQASAKAINAIEEIIADPCYAEVVGLGASIGDNSAMSKALNDGNTTAIYAAAYEIFKSGKRLRILRSIADRIINPIRHFN